MTSKSKVFFPNLDGFRFFCFLIVFFYHSFYTEYEDIKTSSTYRFIEGGLFGNGNIGVNFFFVLSGFLITFLLIRELQVSGRIHVALFWMRRILRIWPLYFLCVFLGFVVFPFLKQMLGTPGHEHASLANYLTFTSNFDIIRHGLPDATILSILWSIAVEEQFYFFWPLLLFIVPQRYYLLLFAGLLVANWTFRAFHDDYFSMEYHTLSCIGDMVIGAIGATLAQQEGFVNVFRNLRRFWIIMFYVALLMILLFRSTLTEQYVMRIFERSLVALVALLIIMEQNYSRNSFLKFSKIRWATFLGEISYGLYCLHFLGILITIQLTRKLGINHSLLTVLVLEPIIALTVTSLLAKISYRYFEKPFLNLKKRFTIVSRT